MPQLGRAHKTRRVAIMRRRRTLARRTDKWPGFPSRPTRQQEGGSIGSIRCSRRQSDDEEIGLGEREMLVELGDLDLRRVPGPVAVEVQGAFQIIVDDPVVAIGGCRTDMEGIRAEMTGPSELLEHGVFEL